MLSRPAAFVALLCVATSVSHARPPEARAGHARMLAALEEIARTSASGYPMERDAARLRETVARLTADAPIERQMRLRMRLAEHELRLGNIERSIALYEEAFASLADVPEPTRSRLGAATLFWLGVAQLRWGETSNCVELHSGEACILPFLAGAVHTRQDGSRKAASLFAQLVAGTPANSPLHIASKWLLNIAHMTLGTYPDGVPAAARIDPAVFTSPREFPRFANVAPALGLATLSLAGGVVVEDLDGDGLLDIVTTTIDPRGQMRLFRNEGEDGFVERTREAGLVGLIGGLNVVHADYDNDGDADLLVLRGAWLGAEGRHPNSLLRNEGDLSFTDVTFEAGLGALHYPTQTAGWADYDNDGDLDLYVGNEAREGQPYPCQLFRNEADGTFTDVAASAGVENLSGTKAVAWGDYDADGYPDLYVSNLQGANRLYRNRGDGTFADVAPQLGLLGPKSSFAAWFWDYDNDGVLDILVNSYQPVENSGPGVWYVAANQLGLRHPAEFPRLYRGDGSGGFEDVAGVAGLHRVTLPMGANFGDLDGDGYLDFYLGTGYPGYEGLVPNVMYWNDAGRAFVDVTYAGGFGHLQKGHGIAFADLDNDGDQDVFAQMGGFFPGDAYGDALFENPGFGNRWLNVTLVGSRSNRSAIGARLRVDVLEAGKRRAIHRTVGSGGSFGDSPLRQQVGLGATERIEALTVEWPTSGIRQTFGGVALDQFVRIVEGKDHLEILRPARLQLR